MEETTFLIIVWENLNALLAAGYRRYGGGREITWYAVPNTASEPAVPLSTILNGAEMESQGWFSEDNSNHQLHDGSLDSFAAWAAEQFGSPVVIYEVDGETGGRWPGNPNIVAPWSRNPMSRDSVTQAVRYSAVEDYNFWYSATGQSGDTGPAQRVVLLYALPVSSGRPASFPVEIPSRLAANFLQVGQPNTTFYEPTYKDALNAVGGMSYAPAVLQHYFVGQWVQRFALSQPYGVLFGTTSSTQDEWTNVAPPFDGLGAPAMLGFRVTNLSEGNLSIRFGPGSPVWDEPVSENGQIKYGATNGLKDATPLVMTPSNRLQVQADGASLNYRIEYWFAPNGKGGCGCGG